ncbi:MAG: 6-phosphogluconolactonase [Candidatus Limnocylindrales bacterium]
MTEHGPDLVPVSDRLAGTSASDLPAPNRGEPDLAVVADPDAVARKAAERIAAALVAAAERRGRADFCTTGGSVPGPIYRLLATSPLCDRIPWPQVHVWWGDDRYVPRGHPESNVTALDDVLLGGAAGERGSAPLPSANIHPFPVDLAIAGDHDNDWCAARYAEEMARQLPLAVGHWPVFDLILVGVGDDGHVLSVFPGSPALARMDWAMGVPAPSHIGPHLPRVTLNPRLLEAAPVLVVTWGTRKAEALSHVFGRQRDRSRWPVQRARRSGAAWILDEAAAAKIPAGLRG